MKFIKLKADLQRNRRHDLKNERKSVPSTVPEPLAYALTHFNAFWSVEAHFYSANLVLPYFSSLSMVAVSEPFPEVHSREWTESIIALFAVSNFVTFRFLVLSPFGMTPFFAKLNCCASV